MIYEQVVSLMRDFTYKPNFRFEVSPAPVDTVHCAILRAEMFVPDSRRPYPQVSMVREDMEIDNWLHRSKFTNRSDRWRIHGLDYVIPVVATIGVHHQLAEDQFYDPFLRTWLDTIDAHERDEWFRVGGQLLHDPHAYPAAI